MSSSAMKMFVSGVHSSRKNVFHSRLVLVWLMAIFFVIIFFSLLWNRILHLLFGMSSVSFMSFLLKAFALLWRELDNVGFMGFLRVRMFTLNLVVVLFWQISCLENYVTKIYESFFLDCLQQSPASLLTGGDKIKMYGGVIGHYWTTCLTWALQDVRPFCWFPSKYKPAKKFLLGLMCEVAVLRTW